MSSYRCVMLALVALAFATSAIDGRSLSGSQLYNGAFPTYQIRTFAASAADAKPLCSVIKYNAEMQPVDATLRVCKVRFDSVFCDGHAVSPSVMPTKLPCGMAPFKCPDGRSLPLIVVNSTVHYHADDKTCDFDEKMRLLCAGKCLSLALMHGTSSCEAPDLPVVVEPC